ncbi:MAG TPA: ribosome maturation factor RimM [Ignavibacteriaceae bacterium]
MNDFYLIAKILSAGKNGFLKVQLMPGFSVNSVTFKFLYVDFWNQKKKIELEETLELKNSVFFKFKNFEDERETSVFIGRDIFLDSSEYEKLDQKILLEYNLEGFNVYKGDELIGVVTNCFETPANPVIEISRVNGSEILIPYVPSIFENIETETKIIRIKVDFGLDDDED